MIYSELVSKMMAMAGNVDNKYRASGYRTAAKIISINCTGKMRVDIDTLRSIGISERMIDHVRDWMEEKPYSGRDRSRSPRGRLSKEDLMKIKGIGSALAERLLDDGVKCLDDLEKPYISRMLTEETKLYLKYKPSDKIPRANIIGIEPHILGIKTVCDDVEDIILVGSYRRHKAVSRDIDVMVVCENLKCFVKELTVRFPKIHIYENGPKRISAIINFANVLDKKRALWYKLDAFQVSGECKVPMLLYATGSKEFNIKMRGIAKKKGLLLNQDGLWQGKVKINLNNEIDYFNYLGIDYVSPEDR